ncbi:recombinase family protein, partial [Bacillus paranthracis]
MTGINFGYMRVSTKEQNLDRQYEALKNYVTDKD